MESGPLEHERVGALTGKIHLYVEEIHQLQLRLLENEKFKELSQSAYFDKLEISEKKIDELHSQLHKTVSERQQLVDENHRLNLTLSTRLRTQEMYENHLLKKIVRTIQNTAVYRAWTKWKNEARKSSFMKRIARRMLNASAARSFQKWNQVSQESKFNKMEDELGRKTKEVEALEFKITNMTGQLAIRNEQLQKIHESHQEASDLRGQVTLLKQQASLEKENYDLRVHTAVLQNQMQGAVAQKDADDFRLHEVIDLQAQVSLMKTRLDDLAGQVVLKDEILATLEQRNQTQLSTIIELESTILVGRQKFNALEKEVALGAAHSSMLFKELKETRSKLNLSSEQNLQLQEKQSGLIRRLDGTSGSIQALWRERESDLEV
jgi:chromosome segregation ATPase